MDCRTHVKKPQLKTNSVDFFIYLFITIKYYKIINMQLLLDFFYLILMLLLFSTKFIVID